MKRSKEFKLLDLIEDVSEVDAIIRLHQTSDDPNFLASQYKALKNKLVKQIIIELTPEINKSPKELLSLKLLLDKFYHNSEVTTEKII